MKNMMKIKDRQKYLKKIGLYKDKVDGIEGKNTDKAYKFFNIIFYVLIIESSKYKINKIIGVMALNANKKMFIVLYSF